MNTAAICHLMGLALRPQLPPLDLRSVMIMMMLSSLAQAGQDHVQEYPGGIIEELTASETFKRPFCAS